jgi:hypothetical protein
LDLCVIVIEMISLRWKVERSYRNADISSDTAKLSLKWFSGSSKRLKHIAWRKCIPAQNGSNAVREESVYRLKTAQMQCLKNVNTDFYPGWLKMQKIQSSSNLHLYGIYDFYCTSCHCVSISSNKFHAIWCECLYTSNGTTFLACVLFEEWNKNLNIMRIFARGSRIFCFIHFHFIRLLQKDERAKHWNILKNWCSVTLSPVSGCKDCLLIHPIFSLSHSLSLRLCQGALQ